MKKILLFVFAIFLYSCVENTPRPIGYNRIELPPQPSYQNFAGNYLSFYYSSISKIDSVHTNTGQSEWFNIVYPAYNARIYCTYTSINKLELNQFLEDSYRFAYSHAVKADDITQHLYQNPNHNTYGILYDIGGNVATPVQFFLTDSVSNFFRASLYYDIQIEEDSVAPVTEFIKNDIQKIIETLEWKIKN